jgi:hypothetical protein
MPNSLKSHIETLREMFALAANERRMKEADALTAAIESLSRQGGGMSQVARSKLELLQSQGWAVNGLALYRNGERGLIDNLGAVHWTRASEAGDCVWTFDDDVRSGMWETACGEAWQFTCDGPEENNFRFCHGCGKPVHIAAAPAPGGGPVNSNNQTRISDEN